MVAGCAAAAGAESLCLAGLRTLTACNWAAGSVKGGGELCGAQARTEWEPPTAIMPVTRLAMDCGWTVHRNEGHAGVRLTWVVGEAQHAGQGREVRPPLPWRYPQM